MLVATYIAWVGADALLLHMAPPSSSGSDGNGAGGVQGNTVSLHRHIICAGCLVWSCLFRKLRQSRPLCTHWLPCCSAVYHTPACMLKAHTHADGASQWWSWLGAAPPAANALWLLLLALGTAECQVCSLLGCSKCIRQHASHPIRFSLDLLHRLMPKHELGNARTGMPRCGDGVAPTCFTDTRHNHHHNHRLAPSRGLIPTRCNTRHRGAAAAQRWW